MNVIKKITATKGNNKYYHRTPQMPVIYVYQTHPLISLGKSGHSWASQTTTNQQ